MLHAHFKRAVLATALGLALHGAVTSIQGPDQAESQRIIVQGTDLAAAKAAVQAAGGEITHGLADIGVAGVLFTQPQGAM